jgi:catechol 2,3-dioxygenase-like lactoylglutathione lyase family enzyme
MPARHALTILAVSDLPRSAAFYAAAFGWPRVVEAPVYVEHALPEGMRLGLYQREGFGRNTGQVPAQIAAGELAPTELYFYPDDLSEAMARLEAVGARKLGDLAARDWGDEAAYFADPDGNVLVLARPLGAGAGESAAGLRALARRWMKLWESDDLSAFDELHAPGFADRSPAGRPADRGAFRESIRERRR